MSHADQAGRPKEQQTCSRDADQHKAYHNVLAFTLLSGEQQLPSIVFSIYKTGSVNEKQQKGLQAGMQSLQAAACFPMLNACRIAGSGWQQLTCSC